MSFNKMSIVRPQTSVGVAITFAAFLLNALRSQAKFIFTDAGNSRVEHPRTFTQRYISRRTNELFKGEKEKAEKAGLTTKGMKRRSHTEVFQDIANGDLALVSSDLHQFMSKVARSIGYPGLIGDADAEEGWKILATDYIINNPRLSDNLDDYLENAAQERLNLSGYNTFEKDKVNTPLTDAILDEVLIQEVVPASA